MNNLEMIKIEIFKIYINTNYNDVKHVHGQCTGIMCH